MCERERERVNVGRWCMWVYGVDGEWVRVRMVNV